MHELGSFTLMQEFIVCATVDKECPKWQLIADL